MRLRSERAVGEGRPNPDLRNDFETTDKSSDRDDTIFTFVNSEQEFPRLIAYRRAREGWLYASVEGRIGAQERKDTYPMRRIDCETGEVVVR